MVITYSETWTIAGLPDAPVFTRDDSMGSASSESMEGRTEYRTESVDASGNEIKGLFGRDGTRSGRFRLIRTEAAHGLTAAATSQQDLQRKAGARALASSGGDAAVDPGARATRNGGSGNDAVGSRTRQS